MRPSHAPFAPSTPTTPAGGQAFSLAHLTALALPPPELVEVAARAGYDYVSPRLIHLGLPGEPDHALDRQPQLLARTKAALASTGVRVHDIELARIVEGVDVRRFLPALEVGAELGARALLCSIWGGSRNEQVDAFARLCDLARPLGMTVDLEYVPIAAVTHLAQAVDVLRAADRPNAGLMIDMHHLHRAGDRVEDLDGLPREWFHFAHLCDAPAAIPADRDAMIHILREARLYVGEGGIDVAGILAHMPAVVHSIELPHRARTEALGEAEHARRCLATLKAYLAQHATATAH